MLLTDVVGEQKGTNLLKERKSMSRRRDDKTGGQLPHNHIPIEAKTRVTQSRPSYDSIDPVLTYSDTQGLEECENSLEERIGRRLYG